MPAASHYILRTAKRHLYLTSHEETKCLTLWKRPPKKKNQTKKKIQGKIALNWECRGEPNDHYFILQDKPYISKNQRLKDFAYVKLNFQADVNLPRQLTQSTGQRLSENPMKKSKFRGLVQESDVPFIHQQTSFVEWIKNLPQLRSDILRLYRINIPRSSADQAPEPGKNDTSESPQDQTFQKFIQNSSSIIIEETRQESVLEYPESQEGRRDSSRRSTQLFRQSSLQTGQEPGDTQAQFAAEEVQFENQNPDQGEEEEEGGSKIVRYNDYLSLIKHFFVAIINSQNSSLNNIIKNTKDINFRLNLSTTRIIFSNIQKQLDLNHDEESVYFLNPIIGIQTLFDSIHFSSVFYLKKDKLTYKQQREADAIDKFTFGMKHGKGKFNSIFAAIFKQSTELLNFDSKEFQSQSHYQESLNNPENFSRYFHIADQSLAKKLMLFDIYRDLEEFDSLFDFAYIGAQSESLNGRKAPKYNIGMQIDAQFLERMRNEQPGGTQPKPEDVYAPDDDLDQIHQDQYRFHSLGLFFKSESILYFQNQKKKLPPMHPGPRSSPGARHASPTQGRPADRTPQKAPTG